MSRSLAVIERRECAANSISAKSKKQSVAQDDQQVTTTEFSSLIATLYPELVASPSSSSSSNGEESVLEFKILGMDAKQIGKPRVGDKVTLIKIHIPNTQK